MPLYRIRPIEGPRENAGLTLVPGLIVMTRTVQNLLRRNVDTTAGNRSRDFLSGCFRFFTSFFGAAGLFSRRPLTAASTA